MSLEETILLIAITAGWITVTVIRSKKILDQWKTMNEKKEEH